MFTLITDQILRSKLSRDDYIRRLNILGSYGKVRIIVRDKNDFNSQIKTLAEINRIHRELKSNLFKIIINSDIKIYKILKENFSIDGIHIKESEIKKIVSSDLKLLRNNKVLIGSSVHSKLELEKILLIGLDYILVSPIFFTKCKSDASIMDSKTLDYINEVSSLKSIETIGLGGVGYADIHSGDVKIRYKKFSSFAIRSLFYESNDLKEDLDRLMEVAINDY